MSYIIVFMVLLLVVLIIKRQRAQSKPAQSRAVQQHSHKSTERLSFLSQKLNKIPVVAQATRARKLITNAAVDDDFSKDESVLELKNDFAQEAQLNIALKKDPTQYPLYLELLNLHLSHQNHLAVQLLLLQIEKVSHPDLYQQALELQRIDQLQHAPQVSPLATQMEPQRPDASDATSIALTNPSEEDLEIVLTAPQAGKTTDVAEYSSNPINALYIQGLDPDPNAMTSPQHATAETELELIEYFIDQAHSIKPSAKIRAVDQVPQTTELPPMPTYAPEQAHPLNPSVREQAALKASFSEPPTSAEIQAADAALVLEIEEQFKSNMITPETTIVATTSPIDLSFQDQHATLEFDFPEIKGTTEIVQDQIIASENTNLFKIEFDPSEVESHLQTLKKEAKK